MNNPAQQPPIIEVQGEPVEPLGQFWLETARNVAKESVGALEEAAKQLITATSLAQTIYFAAISFGDFKKALSQLESAHQVLLVIALVMPLLFWIGSLVYATRVFKPERYGINFNSPEMARQTYENIVSYKHGQLQQAHRWLIWGFVPLVLNIVAYLIFAPVAPK